MKSIFGQKITQQKWEQAHATDELEKRTKKSIIFLFYSKYSYSY